MQVGPSQDSLQACSTDTNNNLKLENFTMSHFGEGGVAKVYYETQSVLLDEKFLMLMNRSIFTAEILISLIFEKKYNQKINLGYL
jgi:hypothetical protein